MGFDPQGVGNDNSGHQSGRNYQCSVFLSCQSRCSHSYEGMSGSTCLKLAGFGIQFCETLSPRKTDQTKTDLVDDISHVVADFTNALTFSASEAHKETNRVNTPTNEDVKSHDIGRTSDRCGSFFDPLRNRGVKGVNDKSPGANGNQVIDPPCG